MIYLLDTDSIIYWIKGDNNLSKKILTAGFDNISSSIITRSELYYGAYKSKKIEKNLESINKLNKKIQFLDFNDKCQKNFGKLKADLEKRGMTLNDFDLMIASTAISYNLILITNNVRHFSRIENLTIENWKE